MLILGLDTDSSVCSAAVYDTARGEFAARYEINNGLTHSVTSAPLIEDMLRLGGIKLSDIDLFAVSVGPGSFTGIRIGVSTIKGLAYGLKKPCAAVTSCLAAAYSVQVKRGMICAALDAKIGRLYCALFKADGDKLIRLSDEACLTVDEIEDMLKDYPDEELTFTGDGAMILAERLGAAYTLPKWAAAQSACGVCLAAQYIEPVTPEKIMPCYVQLPQAQRELEARKGE